MVRVQELSYVNSIQAIALIIIIDTHFYLNLRSKYLFSLWIYQTLDHSSKIIELHQKLKTTISIATLLCKLTSSYFGVWYRMTVYCITAANAKAKKQLSFN